MSNQPVLYLYTCATPVAGMLSTAITHAQERGWDVYVTATPNAMVFLDVDEVEHTTGHAVRSRWRAPDEPRSVPPADAAIVAGASFNTLNKWAAGIADNLVLANLCELMGQDVPIVVLPFFNAAMATHPVLGRTVTTLRDAGVTVLLGPDGYQPHEPHTGSRDLSTYPWTLAFDEIAAARNGD